ncbi:MAG: SRPBCC family protein [Actinomycetes bacterium]
MADVDVTEHIAAAPDAVYDLISDLTRMGEWSPENRGGEWIRGASGPAVGAWFKGRNQHQGRRWTAKCLVTAAERGRQFAFEVHFGPYTSAKWCYQIEPTADGCVVTESAVDQRPGWLRAIYPYVMGIKDRAEQNRVNMRTTLRRLKDTAEATG